MFTTRREILGAFDEKILRMRTRGCNVKAVLAWTANAEGLTS